MLIKINTDKTLSGDARMQEYFTSEIEESLSRFETHITRIEVHLKDENGPKDGLNDVSCLMEARLKGRKPIAVTSQADKVEHAFSAAIGKMETAIDSIVGRLKNR